VVLSPQVYVGAQTTLDSETDLLDSTVMLPVGPSAAESVALSAEAPWTETVAFVPTALIASWAPPPHPTAPLPAQLGYEYPHPPAWYNTAASGCTSSARTQMGATCGLPGPLENRTEVARRSKKTFSYLGSAVALSVLPRGDGWQAGETGERGRADCNC
jgi:hypothetical protein